MQGMIGQLTYQELSELSHHVIQRLLSNSHVISAKTILMYHSLPDEVNTHYALDELIRNGKTVLLPVVTNENDMVLRRYENEKGLLKGTLNIMEPVGNEYNDYISIDVAVVPGVAFDNERNRLGRGKGYYDKFLSKIPHTYKIGMCFDFQKIENLPANFYDITMNEVI